MGSEKLRELILPLRPVYEAKLALNQQLGWVCDQRTRDVWCLGQYIIERFADDGERRRELFLMFNQIVRSADDVFNAAALVIKVGDEGLDIEEYAKDFWTARRTY